MDEADNKVDPATRVADFLARFGRERNLNLPPLDAEGVGMIQRGSAVVSIHVPADKGVLLLLSRVAKAPKLDEAKARRLLQLGFGETGEGACAPPPPTC